METNQSTYLTAVNVKISKPSNQLTDISFQKPTPITNNLNITPEQDTKFSLPQKMETKKQIVEFLKYSSHRSDLLKTEFVNFLIKDENFSGMNESEKFLREKALENINLINRNNLEITKKKEEYEKIILELNKEINNNFKANLEEEEANYLKRKSELENQIKDKKHELSILQNTYRQEYKERYLIVQNQKSEVQNIKINLKQYEKYNLLNKKISFEANQKEMLLNDVKKYMEQSHKIFSEEIENKTKIYKDLELEVHILKQSTESIEKGLKTVIEKRNKVNSLIEEQIDSNHFIMNNLENISNEYFLNKMILLRNTEMNNLTLDELIKQYNEIKKKMNNLKKDLLNKNQEITYLNKKLHRLKNEYNEKKEENKKIIKQNKNNNKFEEKEKLENRKQRKLIKEKINFLKAKNKGQLYISNSKTNFLILCFKFLFQSANILYKSFESSRIDFHFNLDQKSIYCNEIKNSKYYELINIKQKYFNKILTTNGKIFEEPKKFLLFGLKIFLFYISAINFMVSNVFNLSCFNDEDFIDKFPLSQFNSGIFSFKDKDTNENKNNQKSANDLVINKGSNKVIITNFLSKELKNMYIKHSKQNSSILSKRKDIMGRRVEDLINMNKINNNTDIENDLTKNYPTRMYLNFINNKNIPHEIKNSRYIRNHPSSTLLSLKRFFSLEDQKNLLSLKSADLNNKRLNDTKYTRNKVTQRSFEKNLAHLKSPIQKQMNFIKNKIINDSYLSKEYMYEIEIEDYQEEVGRKKIFNNISNHILKYSGQDPQKQLIFSRMMDIRNLELQSGNSNNKSTNMNDITDEKISENKFYEMYDKFKKKYFFNSKKKEGLKINNSYKDITKNKKMNENNSKNKKGNMINNLNLKKGMKFIRNNSDFFYGVKGNNINKNVKNKFKKFELPNIKNKDKNTKNEKSEIVS